MLAPDQPKASARHNPSRRLIYDLIISNDELQRLDVLYSWRLLELPTPSPLRAADGILSTGSIESTTFHRAPITDLLNCSVELEIKILDFDDDPSRWAGVRVRGFHDDIQFGYLAYLRGTGTAELYRAGDVLSGANNQIVSDVKATWARSRLDIHASDIRFWVNGELHADIKDARFPKKGAIYLHTFGTRAEFKNLKVYRHYRWD